LKDEIEKKNQSRKKPIIKKNKGENQNKKQIREHEKNILRLN
jgi:hypothetical protein